MLNNFDEKTLHAAARLMNNDDHRTLIDWMEKESIKIAKEGMDLQDMETVRWYQGGFQLLDELLIRLRTARDIEEKKGGIPPLPKGEIL